jgi:hypothetical protein
VSHASEAPDLASFRGRRVTVIGAGQSALENAAQLTEAGAEVEVLTRQPVVNWLATGRQNKREAGWLEHLLYPPVAVGPVGINWIVQLPGLYRTLPRPGQDWVARKVLRPYASGRLRTRLAEVPITTGVTATRAEASATGLRLTLNDGSVRDVAHVLLGTGYRIDVDRYTLLDPALRRAIKRRDHHPALGAGFESSVPGLHFLGAASTRSFGPLMRFVAGTGYAGRALTLRVCKQGETNPRQATLPVNLQVPTS